MKMKMLLCQKCHVLSAFSLGFKVTTVDNLDVFGLDLKEFAHEIQIAIQCSCTVSQSSSNKMQVVIQGNQIAFVADLLTGKIPFILCQQALHLMRISRLLSNYFNYLHVYQLFFLFLGKYRIPKKYIKGLEKAPKGKRK